MAEAPCSEGSEPGDKKAFERFCSTVSAVTFMSSGTDEEYDLLPLPELDEDFLDGDMYGQDDNAREGTGYLLSFGGRGGGLGGGQQIKGSSLFFKNTTVNTPFFLILCKFVVHLEYFQNCAELPSG